MIGACNPPLAHEALQAEPDLGVFLPCNVVVYEAPDGTHVSAVDPQSMLGAIENPVLERIAAEVKRRFTRVIAALGLSRPDRRLSARRPPRNAITGRSP